MIREEKDSKKAKKLKKKRDEYQHALLEINGTDNDHGGRGAGRGGGSSDEGELSSVDRSLDLDSIDRSMVSKADSSVDTLDLLAESTVSIDSLGRSSRSISGHISMSGGSKKKTYDASTLKKKLKKVKKLLAVTDDEEEREKYIMKYDEYEQALEEIQTQAFHDCVGEISEDPKSGQRSNRTVATAESSSSTVQRGEGSGLTDDEKERYKVLQQKLTKAKKLIKSAMDQGDTTRAEKLESKRQQYEAEIHALKQR
jgi:hypothetical protein